MRGARNLFTGMKKAQSAREWKGLLGQPAASPSATGNRDGTESAAIGLGQLDVYLVVNTQQDGTAFTL